MFFIVIPLILISIVFSVMHSAEQKKRQEAQRQAMEQQAQRTFRPAPAPQTPRPAVRPTVQVPTPARQAAAAPRTAPAVQNPYQAAYERMQKQTVHPKHADCAVTNDYAKTTGHPQHDDCAVTDTHDPQSPMKAAAQPLLGFAPNQILQGVLYAEVFGKPKALQ